MAQHPSEIWKKTEEMLLARTPVDLQEDLKNLKKNEERITMALQKRENQELFFSNPIAFLKKMGVPMSPLLKERLKSSQNVFKEFSEISKPITFKLPNGKEIRPNIKINFVKGGKIK